MHRARLAAAAAATLLVTCLTSCGAGQGDGGSRTLIVPDDYSSIQAAVDDARSGDMVFIKPGMYVESIDVSTADLVIRGADRNSVIIDGGYELDNGIRVLKADGVVVENLTVQNFRFNGIFWTGVNGFRGSYLTAVRNGDYGIYAYASRNGVFEHSYGGASPDAGFYVGQCKPCNTLIADVLAENNGFGFSGTNASEDIMVVNSTFRHNRSGIAPNSGDSELLAPQERMIIAGNKVYDNNNPRTPAIDSARLAMGTGILVAGGSNNVIEKNWISDHEIAGIAVVETMDMSTYTSRSNVISGNAISRSGVADLVLSLASPASNCFRSNMFSTSMPRDIEEFAACADASRSPDRFGTFDFAKMNRRLVPPAADRRLLPSPPPQPSMPEPTTTPAIPAPRASPTSKISLASIVLPSGR